MNLNNEKVNIKSNTASILLKKYILTLVVTILRMTITFFSIDYKIALENF